jgi:membrane protease YdiL (CAAX protease family)
MDGGQHQTAKKLTAEFEVKRSCRGCRKEMPGSARFCPHCGAISKGYQKVMQAEYADQAQSEQRSVWTIAVLFFGGVAAMLLPGSEQEFVNWWQDIGTLVIGFVAIGVLGFDRIGACFGGLARPKFMLLGLLVGFLGYGISHLYVSLLNVLQESPELSGMGLATFLSLVVAAPVIEEWTYRGIAWTAAERIGGVRMAFWLSAALFALAHGLNGGFVMEFPHRFVVGLGFGWLRLKSGSLLPGMAAHAVLNSCAFFAMGGFSE